MIRITRSLGEVAEWMYIMRICPQTLASEIVP
jgi:hypothetical protein